MSLSVLSVASEAYPLVKTGGLADVVGALPAAVAPHGVAMTILLPAYPALAGLMQSGETLHAYADLLGSEARLVATSAHGLDLVLLDAPALFAREGGPYADAAGQDWPDNGLRFAALGRAAADLALGRVGGRRFDLVHAHDWQAGMAPAYLRYADAPRPASVMTIHNIAFQGRFGADFFPFLKLPDAAWSIDGVEYYGGVGFLKAGLHAADAITTVSPTYAEQIRRPAFGMGLEGLIETRRGRLAGILNGIDVTAWDPARDPHLPARFDAEHLAARAENKAAVEQAFGLSSGDGPLFCVVSRLAWQKGMDLLAASLDALVTMGGRLAMLGAGDAELEAAFLAAAARHPGRIGVRIGYDEPLAHRLQGGADAILIPSRFEPCGLTQLYGLRYGCVPVVARTGGLADTVIDANEAALAAGAATGFMIDDLTPDGLVRTIGRVAAAFARPERWATIQRRGMAADFSWGTSGRRYADLYHALAGASPA